MFYITFSTCLGRYQYNLFYKFDKYNSPCSISKCNSYDNCSENVEHVLVNKTLGTQSCFCETYRSREKASVENAISLIRCFLPKKTNFAIITKEQVKQIENILNNRPRKCLGYKTPNEIFNEAVGRTT